MPFITLKTSNDVFYYSTVEAIVKNPIGKVSATLIEYVITAEKEDAENVVCKLYKTKEGFWYDPANPEDQIDTRTKHNIKSAIDAVEDKSRNPKPFHL